MKQYKVLKQKEYDERLFDLLDIETNEVFVVDFYTNGGFIAPVGSDETPKSWKEWLKSFEGKILELDYITPYAYFAGGDNNKIVKSETKQ